MATLFALLPFIEIMHTQHSRGQIQTDVQIEGLWDDVLSSIGNLILHNTSPENASERLAPANTWGFQRSPRIVSSVIFNPKSVRRLREHLVEISSMNDFGY